MQELFSDAWLRELEACARRAGIVAPGEALTVQQVVIEDDGSETAYSIRIDEHGVDLSPGRVDDPDVVFTLDRPAAEAIHRGELSAQIAFMDGRLRVGGDLGRLTRDARALAGLAASFPGTRPG